jgi:arabinogalactan endo-1,4-beta-galactosidase
VSAGSASSRPAVGVQFHAMWSDYTDAQRTRVLDMLQAAGVKWVRIDYGWASVQPDGPGSWARWYLDRGDTWVNAARARGMKVLMTFWMTPGWANGGKGTAVPPTDPAAYAHAAQGIAEHFRGRVSAWEVWNEPNLDYFWGGSPAQYGATLRAAYPAFKAGDPDAQVVFGAPTNNDLTWIKAAYAGGARDSYDVMATHPYQGPADLAPETPDNGTMYVLSHVAAVHDWMTSVGDGAKPIWFTEFGWSSHDNSPGVENWNRGVSEQQQAEYLVRTIKYVQAAFPYVKNLFWYNERNNASPNAPQYDNYGLLTRDLSPKPVYDALKAFMTSEAVASLPSSTVAPLAATTTTSPPSTTSPPVTTATPPSTTSRPATTTTPPAKTTAPPATTTAPIAGTKPQRQVKKQQVRQVRRTAFEQPDAAAATRR